MLPERLPLSCRSAISVIPDGAVHVTPVEPLLYPKKAASSRSGFVVVSDGAAGALVESDVWPLAASTGAAVSTPPNAATKTVPPTARLVVQPYDVSPAVKTWR